MKLKLLFFPLSIIIALFLFIYFTKPLWNNYSENKKNFKVAGIDLKRIQDNKEKLSEILAVYKQVGADDKILLGNAIPGSLSEESLLKELNDMTVDSGVKISAITLAKNEKSEKDENALNDNDIKEVNTSLSLTGNYFNLKKAIYSIENLNRFVRINGFSIKGGETENDLNLDLKATFFYKENVDKLRLSLGKIYLDNLLKSGLEVETINNYMLYREKVIDFNSIGSENKGKDNLFDVLGGTDLKIVDIEEESSAEEAVVDLETDQIESAVENDLEEQSLVPEMEI